MWHCIVFVGSYTALQTGLVTSQSASIVLYVNRGTSLGNLLLQNMVWLGALFHWSRAPTLPSMVCLFLKSTRGQCCKGRQVNGYTGGPAALGGLTCLWDVLRPHQDVITKTEDCIQSGGKTTFPTIIPSGFPLCFQTVKGGISETRIEKRIVITGDADIDHDQVRQRSSLSKEGASPHQLWWLHWGEEGDRIARIGLNIIYYEVVM